MQDEIAEACGFAAEVGDVEDGEAVVALDGLKQGGHVLASFLVEGGERFVEKEDFWIGGESAAQSDALFFSSGEIQGFAVEEVGEAEAIAKLGNANSDFSGRFFL